MEHTVTIMVSFRADTEFGVFADAIYIPEDDWAKTDFETLEAMKQSRVDDWVKRMVNPPKPHELTKADLQAALAEIEDRKAELTAKIADAPDAKPVDDAAEVEIVAEKPK